jgi:hypothetical protein
LRETTKKKTLTAIVFALTVSLSSTTCKRMIT